MRRCLMTTLAVLAGCYRPEADRACTIACDPAGVPCPGAFACNADGLCSVGGARCDGDGGIVGDGGGDAVDASPTAVCAGRTDGLMPRVCFDPPPAGRTLGATFDTSAATDCDAIVGGVCVVVIAPGGVTTNLAATGSRPLALWSADHLIVGASIDVASHSEGPAADTKGAGALSATCPNVASPETTNSGGAGGSFGGLGGGGGSGNGGAPGVPVMFAGSLTVRGGCPGGKGAQFGGSGGNPGGALYLMARNRLTVNGTLNASGAGGLEPAANLGGGGGGSGGLIGLDATTVELTIGTFVLAVGGGGSSGGGLSGEPGLEGQDATCCPIAFAPEAPPSSGTNRGGAGSDPMIGHPGGAGINNAGGGGGGGGAGVIKVFAQQFLPGEAVIQPPPS